MESFCRFKEANMIRTNVNYLRNPELAKLLTRDELIKESNRLERMTDIYSELDYQLVEEYKAQSTVLDKVILNMMVQDDINQLELFT